MMIILIVLIVILFYKLDDNKGNSNNLAMDLLNKKLINGEISEEEYEMKKRLILNK